MNVSRTYSSRLPTDRNKNNRQAANKMPRRPLLEVSFPSLSLSLIPVRFLSQISLKNDEFPSHSPVCQLTRWSAKGTTLPSLASHAHSHTLVSCGVRVRGLCCLDPGRRPCRVAGINGDGAWRGCAAWERVARALWVEVTVERRPVPAQQQRPMAGEETFPGLLMSMSSVI